METFNLTFTRDELCELRCLISSEMSRCSERLDNTGNSNDPAVRKLFGYWSEKYQFLKKSYDKLLEAEELN